MFHVEQREFGSNPMYFTDQPSKEIQRFLSDFSVQTVEAMVNKTTDVHSVTTKNFYEGFLYKMFA